MRTAPLLAAFLLAAAAPAAPPDVAAYKAEIESFHKDRETRLRTSEPWLKLVGLSWLSEGVNSVGSAPKSRVLLPKGKAPATLGVIRLEKGVATFTSAPGAAVTSDGKPVTTVAMKSDGPTALAHGTLKFFLIGRGSRIGVRVLDGEAPALKTFSGIECFPIDPAWRLVAKFEAYTPKKKIEVPTNIIETTEKQESPGAVVFTKDGKTYRLDALVGGPKGELFLVFGDQTNSKETYGGGRFLHTAVPSADGTVAVDFNRSINPPCVFTPYATCPLPPKENFLAVRVPAGEKTYGKR